MSARATHEQARDSRARELVSLEARDARIATARLSLAAAALAILGGIVWSRFGLWAWLGFALDMVVFAVLVFVHASVRDTKDRVLAALRFHERALARIAHAWDSLRTGSLRFRAAEHPFAADLDVFGRASLMQLIDATETRGGEEWLARLLSLESPGAWPGELLDRQKAARDLSERFVFREALAMAGAVLAEEKPDAAPLVAWAERTGALSPMAAWSAWVPAITGMALALTTLLHAPAATITGIVVGQLAIGLAVGRRLAPMVLAVSTSGEAVTRWRAMIDLIEREAFDAPRLVRLRNVLAGDATSASRELAALARIVGYADALRNETFRFFIGPFLMWEAHCARALTHWRARTGRRVRDWLEALAETEALASLGAFTFEHPDFAWPEPAQEPMFIAKALGHPLIADDRRVGNDVRLPRKGTALIVTGSNMSGKSTLLRAMGVNAVLAFAGAPVCARALTIGPARVATSMRIEESLEHGVSHFYAELRRLKRVLDEAQQANAAAVLFLLDEILHGTNARERVIGALAVLRELVGRGALGAVSTHDLGITVLEREMHDAVQNVHFEEQVEGDRMTFDYLLRPGTVQSSNALRLMRALGIDVPEK